MQGQVTDVCHCLTHHRLVNTTPKPRATKNSNGEFVGLLVWSAGGLVVAAGGPADVDDGPDMLAHSIEAI